jgi:hypothetical protein
MTAANHDLLAADRSRRVAPATHMRNNEPCFQPPYRNTGLARTLDVPASSGSFAVTTGSFVARELAIKGIGFKRGLARLEDRWPGTGEPGERFRDDRHVYANDLDLSPRSGRPAFAPEERDWLVVKRLRIVQAGPRVLC